MIAMLEAVDEAVSTFYCLQVITVALYLCNKWIYLLTLLRVSGLSASRRSPEMFIPKYYFKHYLKLYQIVLLISMLLFVRTANKQCCNFFRRPEGIGKVLAWVGWCAVLFFVELVIQAIHEQVNLSYPKSWKYTI